MRNCEYHTLRRIKQCSNCLKEKEGRLERQREGERDTEACDQMKWTLFCLLPSLSSWLACYLIEVWLSATRIHTFVLIK